MKLSDAMLRLNIALYAGGLCLCLAVLAFALSLGFGGIAWLNAIVLGLLALTVTLPCVLAAVLLLGGRRQRSPDAVERNPG